MLSALHLEPAATQKRLGNYGSDDLIGGKLSGLYDEQGNATRGRSDITRAAHEAWSVGAILPSAPFAAAEAFSPEAWKAIGILLGAGK